MNALRLLGFSHISAVRSAWPRICSKRSQSTMASKRPRIRLIFDWDGTMTTSDTTAVIGAKVLAKAHDMAQPGLSSDELPKPMEHYSEQYMVEYREWKNSNFVPPEHRTTVDAEISYLSAFRAVEQRSFLRVRTAALETAGGMRDFEQDEGRRNELMIGIGRQAVRNGVVRIREPEVLRQLIARTDENGSSWGIVSVSWSRRFILGALLEGGLVDAGDAGAVADRITCNELLAPIHLDHQQQTKIICTAEDKLLEMQGLLGGVLADGIPHNRSPISSRDDNAVVSIYVGDSITDLGCFTGPAIGMYLSEGKSDDAVLKTFARLGIDCRSIDSLPTAHTPTGLLDVLRELQQQAKPQHIVCSIQSLEELLEWISMLQ